MFLQSTLLLRIHETVPDSWCLDKSVKQTENGLEHGCAEHWLNSI